MRHKVTPRTRELVSELHRLATLVSPHLALASPAAHAEWDALRALWPSDDELGAGNMAIAEQDLEWMPAKVRRFAENLRGVGFEGAGGVEPAPA